MSREYWIVVRDHFLDNSDPVKCLQPVQLFQEWVRLRPGCNTPGGLEWLAAGCFGPSPGSSGSILDENFAAMLIDPQMRGM